MNRGDLYWVEFPPASGREQAGRRPALVVESGAPSSRLPTVVVVPITSRLEALRFANTLEVAPSRENGLQAPSVLLVFQVRAIDKRRMVPPPMGTLEPVYLEKTERLLRQLLALP